MLKDLFRLRRGPIRVPRVWGLAALAVVLSDVSHFFWSLDVPTEDVGSPAEALGTLLGVWMMAGLVTAICMPLEAALWPYYFREQLRALEIETTSVEYARKVMLRTLVVRIASSALVFLGAALAALPGWLLIELGTFFEVSALVLVGVAVTLGGMVVGFCAVSLANMFADRFVAHRKLTVRSAIRASWKSAKGQWLKRVGWMLLALACELIGAFMLCLPVTQGYGRALGDLFLTERYLLEVTARWDPSTPLPNDVGRDRRSSTHT